MALLMGEEGRGWKMSHATIEARREAGDEFFLLPILTFHGAFFEGETGKQVKWCRVRVDSR